MTFKSSISDIDTRGTVGKRKRNMHFHLEHVT
jgi:hypothetical protein